MVHILYIHVIYSNILQNIQMIAAFNIFKYIKPEYICVNISQNICNFIFINIHHNVFRFIWENVLVMYVKI